MKLPRRLTSAILGLALAACDRRTWVVDDRACIERCTLAAAASKTYSWNREACIQDLCAGHWVGTK